MSSEKLDFTTEKKEITLKVADSEISFEIGTGSYEKFMDEFTDNNKVTPSKRLLRRTVKKEDKEKLNYYLDRGLSISMAGLILNEYRQDVDLEVKK